MSSNTSWAARYEAAETPNLPKSLSSSQRDVFRACMTYRPRPQGATLPPVSDIAEIVGRTATSVSQALEKLKQLGLLERAGQ